MRKAIGLAIAILWAATAQSQTPPDTFKAGIGGFLSPFVVHTSVDSGKLAIRLPASMAGNMITSIRSFFASPLEGPVSPELWQANAAFAWGLRLDTNGWPGPAIEQHATVDLKSIPDLRIGGWVAYQVQWPIYPENSYWLVGYWQKNASFMRMGRNQRDLTIPLTIGYASAGTQEWLVWNNEGFMVEVAYGIPDAGTPSGILDLATGSTRSIRPLYAAINSNGLVISLNQPSDPLEPYFSFSLTVVNTLGQTVVSESGIADFGQITIPWSAKRPSGVYFCRIRLGSESYTVPVVNLK